MGAAESPDRKRRRHDSRERHSSRERPERSRERSRERGSYRGRGEDGSGRHKHNEQDRSERDRPASTSGRSHHDSRQQDSSRQERERHAEPLNGSKGGSSRQQEHETRDRDRDRQADRSRDRSRERHREDSDRDRDRDRQRDREQERERDWRHGDRGRHGKGSSRDAARREDLVGPSRQEREDRHDERGRGAGPGQQREHAGGPPRQQEHQQRDGRGGGGGGGGGGRGHHPQQQRRGESEPEGKPKWGKPEDWAADEAPPPGPPKEAPNMGLSGKLAAETNKTADGTAELKFQAPAEARVCKKPVWKLFVYKGSDLTGDPINLTQLPFYLFGKDRKVADIPTDHPSCSRQHAVIVFREVQADAPDGIGYVHTIKPYLLDLETTNGTTINNERLEGARYYELLTGDVVRFGFSSRDYVIMNESVVQ